MKPKKLQPVCLPSPDMPAHQAEALIPRAGRATQTAEDMDFSNCGLAKRYNRHWDDYIELSPPSHT